MTAAASRFVLSTLAIRTAEVRARRCLALAVWMGTLSCIGIHCSLPLIESGRMRSASGSILSGAKPRTDSTYRELGAGSQVQIVTSANEDRARASARANGCSDRGAFTSTDNRAQERTKCRPNARSRHRRSRLTSSFRDDTFVVHTNVIAIGGANTFDVAIEWLGRSVSKPDPLEVERHFRASSKTTGPARLADVPFNHSSVESRWRTNSHRETVARASTGRAQVFVQDSNQLGLIGDYASTTTNNRTASIEIELSNIRHSCHRSCALRRDG